MPDQTNTRKTYTVFERRLTKICQIVAATGGMILIAVMLITVTSIIGRALFGRPLPGDFELVELGCALAIFAFLPYCHITRGNIVVDFFTAKASTITTTILALVGDVLFMLIAAIVTWRLALGGLDLLAFGEETMVLRLPRWWAFVFILPASALLVVVCIHTSWCNLRKFTGE